MMSASAAAAVVSPRVLLITVAVLSLLSNLGQGCYSESYIWDESHNPLGPSRCRSNNNNCDCDGLRTCSFWGYCQGPARYSGNSTSPELATPPRSPQLGSSLEESHNGSGGGGGISSGGIRTLIIVPIVIFGTVLVLGAAMVLLCCWCNRNRGLTQQSSGPSVLGCEGRDGLSSTAASGMLPLPPAMAGIHNNGHIVIPMCAQKDLKQQQQQEQHLRKDPPTSLTQFINPVCPNITVNCCSSSDGTPTSRTELCTDGGSGSNGEGMMLHGLRQQRIGPPESSAQTPAYCS
ncbi:hypothetical protein Vretimale_2143 [Volvox reticuliferus]|uniref:Uncharacterized protein n=1 Tax=Volvox reticuliferus TaxID=1737510 RepID=A0A8J4DB07_9CHLO|nr:hypothetical protein Vretifemale_4556 [Volvox reticuliferus]GIL96472.1 hypothetical protein Vretimale_2143 [Volvox reticuliferus]